MFDANSKLIGFEFKEQLVCVHQMFKPSMHEIIILPLSYDCGMLSVSPLVPFDVARLFYICDVPFDSIRGEHANRNSQFVFVCVAGSCVIHVERGLDEKADIILDNPQKMLWVNKMTWKEMHGFTEGAVLLVLSDQHYDSTEYIKDHEEFISELARD